jgi:glycosyltransferase involved in cell wall biosynthesis
MPAKRKMVLLLKGYPRLSETFIAQEILGLEREGFEIEIVAMRRPTDTKRHPVHDEIRAPVRYLPEYLYHEPLRVLRGLAHAIPRRGFLAALRGFLADLIRDPTPNRVRRFGQAAVLAAEWPEGAGWLHVHFIHTPASVARYASRILGVPFTVSAHAKDIWTIPEHELATKLGDARWTVTCSRAGHDRLAALAAPGHPVHLCYHGLDLSRFPPTTQSRPARDGSDADDPVVILSVGRAVPKKGFEVLLRALAALPRDLAWRLVHAGGGAALPQLRSLAVELGIADRISWRGPVDQSEILALNRSADLFALASRVSGDGDRDGLPNVLVEAASQGLACVSTAVSGIPELLTDGDTGLLVPPDDPAALALALARAMREPGLRNRLGAAAEARVRERFDLAPGIQRLKSLFETAWAAQS